MNDNDFQIPIYFSNTLIYSINEFEKNFKWEIEEEREL